MATTLGSQQVVIAATDGTGVIKSLPDVGNGGQAVAGTAPIGLTNLAWSLDNSQLAFNLKSMSAAPSLMVIDPFAADSVGDSQVLFLGGALDTDPEADTLWKPVFIDRGLLVIEAEVLPSSEVVATDRGLVLDPSTGRDLETLQLPPGLVDLDSDPSGHYLIYVLEDGGVHWMSTDGESGTLINGGFRSASW